MDLKSHGNGLENSGKLFFEVLFSSVLQIYDVFVNLVEVEIRITKESAVVWPRVEEILLKLTASPGYPG